MSMTPLRFTRALSDWLGTPTDNLVIRRLVWGRKLTCIEDFLALTPEEILATHGFGPLLTRRAEMLQLRAKWRLAECRATPDLKKLEKDLLAVLAGYLDDEPPYHNPVHMRGVWSIAQELWLTEKQPIPGLSLEWSEAVLMAAALLHDLEHSGGQYPDSENIMVAREAVRSLTHYPQFDFSMEVIHAIDHAIRCTEFPFTVPPSNAVEKVLRDADILYAAWTDNPDIILTALREEVEVSQRRCISLEEMLAGQRSFMESAVLYTTAGQVLWDRLAPKYFEKMRLTVERNNDGL